MEQLHRRDELVNELNNRGIDLSNIEVDYLYNLIEHTNETVPECLDMLLRIMDSSSGILLLSFILANPYASLRIQTIPVESSFFTNIIPYRQINEYENNLRLGDYIGYVHIGATDEQLKQLKVIKYDHTKHDQDTCLISLDNLNDGDDIVILDCSHLFKKNALFEWLKEKKICAVCKHRIFE